MIMNRSAVALAADSAATLMDNKIFNSVNKLFSLSKYHPVGIMIYSKADFMSVPWESIIKIYRRQLGKKRFDTLQEYSSDFISFLNSENPLFPETEQMDHVFNMCLSYFELIKDNIDLEVSEYICEKGKVEHRTIKSIVKKEIRECYNQFKETPDLVSMSYSDVQKFIDKHIDDYEALKKSVFQKLPLDKEANQWLYDISCFLFCKNIFETYTGVVIAGFGEREVFPVATSFCVETVIHDKLKYVEQEIRKISYSTHAYISPFAQSDMVFTFMEGIDPEYHKLVNKYFAEILTSFPMAVANNLNFNSEKEKRKIVKDLQKIGTDIYKKYIEQTKEHRKSCYTDKILDAVAHLPKDELASMAESLVNLTSFKRKVSMDAETVGGPVDVAVISKGDGFIWIKRKHYFPKELNPSFFSNYYLENQIIKGDGSDE